MWRIRKVGLPISAAWLAVDVGWLPKKSISSTALAFMPSCTGAFSLKPMRELRAPNSVCRCSRRSYPAERARRCPANR